MALQLFVGLHVVDPEKYAQYRAEIAPLLQASGGAFRYDFEVARTLKSDAGHAINRVFLLQFPDRATKDGFFSDPRYLDIRRRLFAEAVEGTTILAECG